MSHSATLLLSIKCYLLSYLLLLWQLQWYAQF